MTVLVDLYQGDKLRVDNMPSGVWLLSQEQRVGYHLINIRDFNNFKNQLDKLNITDRSLSSAAYNAITVLNDEISEVSRIVHDHDPLDIPPTIKTAPYDDQWPGIHLFLYRQFVTNWDTMGSGKTFMALFAFAKLQELGLAHRMLVICPNHVKKVWEEQIKEHTHFRSLKIGNGTDKVLWDLKTRFNHQDILITHYDMYANEDIRKYIKQLRIDLVVLDEAHMIKNLYGGKTKKTKKDKSQRTRGVLEILQELQRYTPMQAVNNYKITDPAKPIIWTLTGTPVSENPSNSYVLLTIVEPYFKISKWTFDNFFNVFIKIPVHIKGTPKTIEIRKSIKFRNLDQLTYFNRFAIRRSRSELTGMPEKIQSDRLVELYPEQRTAYNNIKEKTIKELLVEGKNGMLNKIQVRNILMRLRQIANHPHILKLGSRSVKHDIIESLITELLTDHQKVIVWGVFREGLELLHDQLEKADIKNSILYGGMTNESMDKIQHEFESDNLDVILASIGKMGTGTDYFKRARTAIYLDLPLSFVEYSQSQDRIIRRGVESPGVLIRVMAEGSVDQAIDYMLQNKQELSEAVIEEHEEVNINEIIHRL